MPKEHLEYKNNKLYIDNEIVLENFEHGFTDDYSLKGGKNIKIPSDSYFCIRR